jgi:cell wall-associated NlpC family hydrolase
MISSKWIMIMASIGILTISCAPLRPLAPDSTTSSKTSQDITGISEWDKVLSPWLGTPYVYGGNTKRGTDCSGFTSSVYMEKQGISIPRTSSEQFKIGKSISVDNAIVGDLVFFGKVGNVKNVNHVGIYVGKGKFMHASTSQGVTVTSLSDNYWKPLYLGTRRL